MGRLIANQELMNHMTKKFNLWRGGIVLIPWITLSTLANCLCQDASKLEDSLPKEIRNRVDVQQIIQRLRFLRMYEANYGENHPKKESTRVQIRESEYELSRIVKLNSGSPKSDLAESSIQVEDAMPNELRDRPDVQLMIQKLRFMRMNEKYFGENHPNKKFTQEQIRNHESDLKSILELENLPSPQPTVTEASTINGNDNRPEVQSLIQKILFLKLNGASFGENHPSRKSIQEQIQKHEAALLDLADLSDQPPVQPTGGQRSSKAIDLMSADLQKSRDVRVIVQKLAFLRLNEANYGENHPKWNLIQTEIRELEAALREMIKLEQQASRNPFRRDPN